MLLPDPVDNCASYPPRLVFRGHEDGHDCKTRKAKPLNVILFSVALELSAHSTHLMITSADRKEAAQKSIILLADDLMRSFIPFNISQHDQRHS
jgi:hypothetical protein